MKLAILTTFLLALLAGPAFAAPQKDVDDPFYRWNGPLADVAPGTVLRTRDITAAVQGATIPVSASQVLYRTTKQSGAPIAVVATIVRPLAANSTQILSYQTAYDDLGSSCTPSYAWQGGATSGVTPPLEIGFQLAYVAQGYTVVTSDYEGLTHDYTAGQGAGYATLDAIRATRKVLGVPDATPVGLLGYSGGATATQWASELATQYSPETNIVGVAEGGIPVHYAHIIDYVDGSADWGGVLPYVLVGLFRGAELDITRYLSDKGKAALKYVSDKCLDTSSFAGAHMSDFLIDHRDYRTIRPLAKVVNSQIMGTLGTPKAPVFMADGNKDGIGDGVMITSDVESLAHQYCQKGVPVSLRRYDGMDHIAAIAPFEAEAIAFLQARMNGLPVVDECATIGPGSTLGGLTLPPLPALILGKVRHTRRGGYTLGLLVDRESADTVAVSVYTTVAGRRKRVATVRPAGALTTTRRTVTLPLKGTKPGRTYDVVVSATADEEKISGRTSFALRRRPR